MKKTKQGVQVCTFAPFLPPFTPFPSHPTSSTLYQRDKKATPFSYRHPSVAELFFMGIGHRKQLLSHPGKATLQHRPAQSETGLCALALTCSRLGVGHATISMSWLPPPKQNCPTSVMQRMHSDNVPLLA